MNSKIIGNIIIICSVVIMIVILKSFHDYNKSERYCGTIIEIYGEQEHSSRRRTRVYYHTTRYVLIKFDNGVVKAINLEPTSYYTSKIGKQVCLELAKSFMEGRRNTQ